VVQRDAVGELPPGVVARERPVVAGARRALLGLGPVGRADLVHGLDVDLPLPVRAPSVSTVHDTAVFDTPWTFSARRSRGERLLLRQALHRADRVIAVSAFTAGRVHDLFGRDAVVTPLAPAERFRPPAQAEVRRVRARYGLPARFVLHVGTIEARKDVGMLAAAARTADVPLVLAGGVATGQHVPVGAVHLGYVPSDDLPALYGAATAVGYPSRYEGFGLPPLEAMACGAAVVASRVGALPETLGEAALLVAPRDEAALTAALRRLVHDRDLREHLQRTGLTRAAGFRWSTTAQRTLEVYRGLGVAC
jgi:glycosyltransferase involved in cell wall biosynthesis